ncbi:MAG: amidohydrolase family protein [Gemmatimonadota bacterium]
MRRFALRFFSILVVQLMADGVPWHVTQARAQEPAEFVGESELVVVRAARMLDVVSGEIVPNAVVVVEGGEIREVHPEAAPSRARTIDLGDLTLLPGLIDAHTHLAYDLEGDWSHREVTEATAEGTVRAVRNARRTLEAGFTTVRDVGASPGFVDVAIMRGVERGWIVGPRVVPAGHSLGITGGHCDATGYIPGVLELGPEQGVADGVDEVIRAVRYQIKHGARVIKVCATAGVLSFEESVGAQQYTEDELRAAVEEAARHGMKVAAHAHGTEGIKAAIRAGVASIEHGSLIDDEAVAMMKERDVYLVPTTYLADAIDLDLLPPPIRAKAEWVLPRAKENLRRAIRAGVPIAFGTDAAVFPHGENAKEFAALVERGMAPLEAIRSATIHAADLLGVDDRGVIAAGKLADLIAVPGNPLQDVHALENVRFVMLGGDVVKEP